MTTNLRSFRNAFFRKSLMIAAAASLTLPAIASAADRYDRGDRYDSRPDRNDHRDFRPDNRRDDSRDRFDLNIRIGSGPVYEDRTEKIWVEPIYRTVCDRVWRPAVVQEVCDRVWVEPCYEDRETVDYERGRRVVRRERVLVSPGHYEERRRQVVISEGHFENIERQELIAAGHWEYRTTRVRVDDRANWGFGFFSQSR